MKNITMDYDTYTQELAESYKMGESSVYNLLKKEFVEQSILDDDLLSHYFKKHNWILIDEGIAYPVDSVCYIDDSSDGIILIKVNKGGE